MNNYTEAPNTAKVNAINFLSVQALGVLAVDLLVSTTTDIQQKMPISTTFIKTLFKTITY